MKYLLFLILSFYSGFSLASKTEEYNPMEALYLCTSTLISGNINTNNVVVFDDYLGFKQFINLKLEPWMVRTLHEVSKLTLDKYNLKNSSSPFSVDEAREYFYSKLKFMLVESAGYSIDKEEYCEWEMQSIIEKLSENKLYQIYNSEFKSFLMHYKLPMNIRASEDNFFLLMFLSGDYEPNKKGVCKEFESSSDLKSSKVMLCN